MTVRIDSIRVLRITDEYPDLSYLETEQGNKGNIISSCRYTQEEYLKNPEQVQGYIDEDKKRLQEFYDGSICMIGIQVKAEVSYSINPKTNDRRIEWFTSGGLWGIESDSDESYLKDIQVEQIDDLRDHLKQFNVDLSNFDELAEQAIEDIIETYA